MSIVDVQGAGQPESGTPRDEEVPVKGVLPGRRHPMKGDLPDGADSDALSESRSGEPLAGTSGSSRSP